MKFYYFVTSLLNPIALGWVRLRTRLKPRERVRLILHDEQGRILLVRPVIGSRKWELPGGMPHVDESFEAAVVRELYEETGIAVRQTDVKFCIEYLRPYPMRIYEAYVKATIIQKNKFEIREARWFSPSELPVNTVPFIANLLKER